MAKVSDYIVEVRDVNFVRQGQIAPEYLDVMYTEVFRSVGKWTLKLPTGHPLLPVVKAKGSGIIITEITSGKVFSGRMQSCVLSQDAEDPDGTWVASGVDDNVIAAASVAYPDTANAANAQTAAYWTITSDGEDIMKRLVNFNIGPAAIASRKYPWLSYTTNLHRGATISSSLRFDLLADAFTAIGIRANLGWRFYQSGAGIVFDVYTPSDKSATVRLDIRNGGLESTELGYSAPTATQVLVLGQGEGADRTVLPVTTTASLAEATAWGLRWEVSKDERNTDVTTELQQAGEEILTEQGSTINSLKVVPSDTPNQRLGVDWFLGDIVTVLIDGSPATSTVTEVATAIGSAGVIRQATVGDPVGFSWDARQASLTKQQDTRISALEATVDAAVPLRPGSLNLTGMVMMTAAGSPPTGWLICQGQAISRVTYSALFAAIGTTYGAGDGSTTFNVPDMQGRVPVGVSATDTDFPFGGVGGSKTVAHNHGLAGTGWALFDLDTTTMYIKRSNVSTGLGWTSTNGGSQAFGGTTSARSAGTDLTGITNTASPSVVQPFRSLNFIIKT